MADSELRALERARLLHRKGLEMTNKEVAAMVVRAFNLLPDDFGEVAREPYATELSQLSVKLADWAEKVLGYDTRAYRHAAETSLLDEDEDGEGDL